MLVSSRWYRPLVAGLVLFGATLTVLAEPADEMKPGEPIVGRTHKRTYDFKEANKEGEYALFVPTGYDKAKKAPLIVALHGLGATPTIILRHKGFTDLAEKHGTILAAPMGYNTRGWYGSKGQTSPRDQPKNLGELSEKDVLNVLADVRKQFTVDEERIYLLGHSMGGGGTWHLGIKYPDIWAGLAPIAPAMFRAPTDLEKIKHIPVIVVQGDKDFLVPVAGTRRWVEKMKDLKMTCAYEEVAGGGHVDVVSPNLPKIFDFFQKHRKQAVAKPEAK